MRQIVIEACLHIAVRIILKGDKISHARTKNNTHSRQGACLLNFSQ
jgi:hypothetical protein